MSNGRLTAACPFLISERKECIMIRDRRGDIGFPEAMLGTATVCIVLTVFLAYAVTVMWTDSAEQADIGWERFRNVGITDGEYSAGTIPEDLVAELSCSGVKMSFVPQDVPGICSLYIQCGKCRGDKEVHDRLISVESDDGRTIPTVLEVIVYT